MQEVALVELHDNVALLPEAMLFGLTLTDTVGAVPPLPAGKRVEVDPVLAASLLTALVLEAASPALPPPPPQALKASAAVAIKQQVNRDAGRRYAFIVGNPISSFNPIPS
jgi:hypothetical protein